MLKPKPQALQFQALKCRSLNETFKLKPKKIQTPPTAKTTVWFLVGNGGMDPYGSPYIFPNSLHNPFPHSLLRTRQGL